MNLRCQKIISVLNDNNGFIRIGDLSNILEVSEMTIRRDLEQLEKKGLLQRIHGGAVLNHDKGKITNSIKNIEKKQAIARAAFKLLEQEESVYIDSGTTPQCFAEFIEQAECPELSIITNSFIVANILAYKKSIDTIITGGKLHTTHFALIGPLAEESVKKFNYNKAFLAVGGISLSDGASVLCLDEIPIKKKVIENSDQIIILADSSKFNKSTLGFLISFEKIDIIVTDWEIDEVYLSEFQRKGIKVIVAEKE